jgi:hypothetical protein
MLFAYAIHTRASRYFLSTSFQNIATALPLIVASVVSERRIAAWRIIWFNRRGSLRASPVSELFGRMLVNGKQDETQVHQAVPIQQERFDRGSPARG